MEKKKKSNIWNIREFLIRVPVFISIEHNISQVNLFIEHNINTTFVDPKCFTDGQAKKKEKKKTVIITVIKMNGENY